MTSLLLWIFGDRHQLSQTRRRQSCSNLSLFLNCWGVHTYSGRNDTKSMQIVLPSEASIRRKTHFQPAAIPIENAHCCPPVLWFRAASAFLIHPFHSCGIRKTQNCQKVNFSILILHPVGSNETVNKNYCFTPVMGSRRVWNYLQGWPPQNKTHGRIRAVVTPARTAHTEQG